MKKVEKLHGVSFHLSPFPSRSHISRQCSCSPSSYLERKVGSVIIACQGWSLSDFDNSYGYENGFCDFANLFFTTGMQYSRLSIIALTGSYLALPRSNFDKWLVCLFPSRRICPLRPGQFPKSKSVHGPCLVHKTKFKGECQGSWLFLTISLYVVLQILLLFRGIYASQMHSMKSAVLLSLVPVCLKSMFGGP